MTDDLRRGVRDLCSAVHALLTTFDRQDEQAEAARKRAEASRAAFDRLMETYRSGGGRPSGAERSETLLEALGSGTTMDSVCAEMRETADLNRRWEAGFCDIYEALIRLNAHPEVREGVEQIARQVRTIRLLQIAPDDLAPPQFSEAASNPVPPLGLGELFAGEGSAADHDRFVSMMGEVDDYAVRVGNSLTERVVLTREHLEELLAAAEALA